MIKKKIFTFFVILIIYLLQTTVFRSLELAGVVPNLILVVVVSYAYLRGRKNGLIIGFFCGLMLDLQYGSVIGLYAFIMMTIGFLVGFCKKFYFRDRLHLPILLILGSDFIYGLYYYICEFLLRGKLDFIYYFVHRILPEIIYTTLIGILLFLLLSFVEQRFFKMRREDILWFRLYLNP